MLESLEIPEDDKELIRDIMTSHDFSSLKKTQEIAFEDGVLDSGNHLLVAETGNGKTLCAEAITRKEMENDGRVAYLVPSKQLVRDKKETIEEWAEEKVGQGAYQSADIIVATFDSFYRALLQNTGGVRNLDLVILDDFHEIYGSYRGPDIEKTLSAILYENIDVFAMSATVGNPEEIGDWMDATVTVSPESREIEIQEEIVELSRDSSKKNELAEFISNNKDKAPFLVFNYAKSWTESRAEELSSITTFNGPPKNEIRQKLENKVEGELTDTLERLADMISEGIAYHHSGLPTNVKYWIEDLYYKGDIKCLYATTTIAYGFDAPVQTVVVGDIRRGPEYVGVWEYLQWIGRGARPGYGYDKGYAYTLTKNPEEIKDRYFEPRTLEPVKTHIEPEPQFRKLLVELIDTGWTTPSEIEDFLHKTLYWTQMGDSGSWGRMFGGKQERLENRLRENASWLEEAEFIKESRTAQEFMTTTLGEASVDFIFSTFGSYTLSQIREFYTWLQTSEVTPLMFLSKTIEIFELEMRDSVSDEVLQHLKEEGVPPNNSTQTAAVLHWYWARNVSKREIEEKTGMDATSMYTIANRIGGVMDASQVLFDAAPNAQAEEWFEDYIYQIRRGIKQEEISFVREVRGVGRYTIRKLNRFLSSNAPELRQIPSDESLGVKLDKFYEHVGTANKFENVLEEHVTGIGPKNAERIRKLVENTNVKDYGNSETEEKASGPTTSTLDDF